MRPYVAGDTKRGFSRRKNRAAPRRIVRRRPRQGRRERNRRCQGGVLPRSPTAKAGSTVPAAPRHVSRRELSSADPDRALGNQDSPLLGDYDLPDAFTRHDHRAQFARDADSQPLCSCSRMESIIKRSEKGRFSKNDFMALVRQLPPLNHAIPFGARCGGASIAHAER
jgi:hypothetical protein